MEFINEEEQQLDKLLKNRELVILKERRDSFLGVFKHITEKIENDLKSNISEPIYNEKSKEFDYSDIFKQLNLKYHLVRWSAKENIVNKDGTYYEIYRVDRNPKISLYFNKLKKEILIKYIGKPNTITLKNPSNKTLLSLLKDYYIECE